MAALRAENASAFRHLAVVRYDAFAPPPVGSAELQGIDPAVGTELGEVILGRHPGRESPEQITVYKSMGHAVEDVVSATLVYQAALAGGAGTPFMMENRP